MCCVPIPIAQVQAASWHVPDTRKVEDWTVEEEMPGAIHVATLSLSLANSTFATVSAANVFCWGQFKMVDSW